MHVLTLALTALFLQLLVQFLIQIAFGENQLDGFKNRDFSKLEVISDKIRILPSSDFFSQLYEIAFCHPDPQPPSCSSESGWKYVGCQDMIDVDEPRAQASFPLGS